MQGTLSDPFNIDMKKDDRLSTILFNLAIEKVVRAMTINCRGIIFTTSKQLAAFTDDADLIWFETLPMKESFVEMQRTAKEVTKIKQST